MHKQIEVTFTNITLTVGNVETPREAYDFICRLWSYGDVRLEYTTDEYFTSDNPDDIRTTEELFG